MSLFTGGMVFIGLWPFIGFIAAAAIGMIVIVPTMMVFAAVMRSGQISQWEREFYLEQD